MRTNFNLYSQQNDLVFLYMHSNNRVNSSAIFFIFFRKGHYIPTIVKCWALMLQKQISIRITSISAAGGLALFVCSRRSGPRRVIPNSVLCWMLSLTSCHRRGHDIMVVVLSSVPCWLGFLRRTVQDIYASHQWWRRTWRILIFSHSLSRIMPVHLLFLQFESYRGHLFPPYL